MWQIGKLSVWVWSTKTRFWCALMLCNPHMKQGSKLAVKRTKLELCRFNGTPAKLKRKASSSLEASTVSDPVVLWFGLITCTLLSLSLVALLMYTPPLLSPAGCSRHCTQAPDLEIRSGGAGGGNRDMISYVTFLFCFFHLSSTQTLRLSHTRTHSQSTIAHSCTSMPGIKRHA